MDIRDKIEMLNRRHDALLQDRSEWDDLWTDIQEHVLPNYGRFMSRGAQPNDSEQKRDKIVDRTAETAIEVLTAGIHDGLTSYSRPWFKMGLPTPELEDNSAVRAWLDEVEKIMYWAMATSNFYNVIYNVYFEQAGFGTGGIYVEKGQGTPFRYVAQTIGSYSLQENAFGQIETAFFKKWMTAEQCAQFFGLDALSDGLKTTLNNNPDEYVTINHAVFKRQEYDGTMKDNLNMPFECVYWEDNVQDQILMETGYKSFPYRFGRWNKVGESVYGFCPTMTVLPDIKQLQSMQKAKLKAVQKEIDPPMKTTSRLGRTLSHAPSAVNFVDNAGGTDSLQPLYQIRPNIGEIRADIAETRKLIRDGYYNDIFLLFADTGTMTAREVAERHDEKLLLLAPMIGRQMYEILDPLMERQFELLVEQGYIPPVPPELEGMELKVEYVSTLAQAQKLVSMDAINRFTGYVGGVAQYDPDALLYVDTGESIKAVHNAVGAPAKMLRDEEEVAQLKQARMEQQQQAMAQQEMAQMAETAKTASQTDTEGQNMLTDLVGGGEEA